jgi:hypothetical protein
MTIEISGTAIVDKALEIYQDYQQARKDHKKAYPYRQYITNETKLGNLRDYIAFQKLEKALYTIRDIFYYGGYDINLEGIYRVANRWYNSTEWQKNLSDETAEKLVNLFLTRR